MDSLESIPDESTKGEEQSTRQCPAWIRYLNRLDQIKASAMGPLLIALSLPIVLLAYIIPYGLVPKALAILGVGIAMIGGLFEYLFLLGARSVRDMAVYRRLGLKTLLMPAVAVALYMGLIGIIISFRIVRGALEYTYEKPLEEHYCARYYTPALSLPLLGIPLFAFQKCALTSLSRLAEDLCATTPHGHSSLIDLPAVSDNGEE